MDYDGCLQRPQGYRRCARSEGNITEPPGHGIESLRHLWRLYEVIRAGEVTLKPLLAEGKTDNRTAQAVSDALQYRLEELELLCLQPRYFHHQSTFDQINLLKSKLLYFRSLLQENVQAAVQHWQANASDQFTLTLASVSQEINEEMDRLQE